MLQVFHLVVLVYLVTANEPVSFHLERTSCTKRISHVSSNLVCFSPAEKRAQSRTHKERALGKRTRRCFVNSALYRTPYKVRWCFIYRVRLSHSEGLASSPKRQMPHQQPLCKYQRTPAGLSRLETLAVLFIDYLFNSTMLFIVCVAPTSSGGDKNLFTGGFPTESAHFQLFALGFMWVFPYA